MSANAAESVRFARSARKDKEQRFWSSSELDLQLANLANRTGLSKAALLRMGAVAVCRDYMAVQHVAFRENYAPDHRD